MTNTGMARVRYAVEYLGAGIEARVRVFLSAYTQEWAVCLIALDRSSAAIDQVDDQDDYRNSKQQVDQPAADLADHA